MESPKTLGIRTAFEPQLTSSHIQRGDLKEEGFQNCGDQGLNTGQLVKLNLPELHRVFWHWQNREWEFLSHRLRQW